jgi:hypothetical protein
MSFSSQTVDHGKSRRPVTVVIGKSQTLNTFCAAPSSMAAVAQYMGAHLTLRMGMVMRVGV